jgi:hypothetical protein
MGEEISYLDVGAYLFMKLANEYGYTLDSEMEEALVLIILDLMESIGVEVIMEGDNDE